ncbi:MAG TPA: type II secretion system minor pseudopilin GspK [Pseudomonadota bacterium]|nr:type II secretion system minor pseudopilin GspK [Xanthomonadales bacterium]MBP8176764.1 type II secretion system minor pseudopilin GspK [Xanthomonadales bacterium]HQY36689.1 type II secretion system minor pseudopilin GspK [Pseudomonadota bacterium]
MNAVRRQRGARAFDGPRRQRGVALITALLVFALGLVLVAMLVDQGAVALARTRNLARAGQADAYALGLEDYAIEMLRRDQQTGDGADTRLDSWSVPLPPTPVPGGTIAGRLTDASGCFNLNNLVAGDAPVAVEIERFQRLLVALQLDPALADAVVDWLDPDLMPGNRGAEDQAYAGQAIAYRAGNRPFADGSELRLVRGVDREAWRRLAPHVCALPAPSLLNVNTAGVPVLMALDPALTEAAARQLLREGGQGYDSIAAFQQALAQQGVPLPELAGLDVRSQYFRALGVLQLDGVPYAYASLIERRAGQFRVVARWRGRD